ncbi:MAG: DUF433 domain-containing protein [Gemmataceae bacterium]
METGQMPLPEIQSDPRIMLGKPVIVGTRIPVELLLEKLAAGESVEQIQRAHPHLPEGSIAAALSYAVAILRNESVIPLERRSA